MCGIAGIVGLLAARRDLLEKMLVKIRHRGPDGNGTFLWASVAFAHARLSIIDLTDSAAQPMHDPETGNVIIFNGEIYNYKELAKDLGSWPAGMSRGDSATLLRAYSRFGVDALLRLRGMFAFAIWDARQRRILLARDRFGIKPLYYRRINSSLLFASEIRPLLFQEFPHNANENVLAGFLAFRHLDTTEQTCFNEVFQLQPAHYLWVEPDGSMTAPQRYWWPPRFGSKLFGEAEGKQVADAVSDTVLAHLESDVPVGAFVSGGIDSSTVVCTATNLIGYGSFSTYSSVLDESQQNSENRLIPVVLDQIGSHAYNLLIDGKTFVDDLPKVFDFHEEPLADASMYAHWRLCELARNSGIRVLLSGNGGDEIFGGYGSHVYARIGQLLAKGLFPELVKTISAYARMGWGGRANLFMRGMHESLPFWARTALKHYHARKWLRHTLFEPLAKDLRFYYELGEDRLENAFLENIEHWTVPPFLHYEDRNGMAFGVEIRTPFLDHKLMEFVWRYDPLTLLAGPSKHALRVAMRGTVPDAVLDQSRKYGFAAPLSLFMHTDENRFTDCYHDLVAACPYFNNAVASRILNNFKDRRETAIRPWRVFSVALWYARFISNESTRQF